MTVLSEHVKICQLLGNEKSMNNSLKMCCSFVWPSVTLINILLYPFKND